MIDIDVVIADPCFLIREGLKKVIDETNIKLKGEITSHTEFLHKVQNYKPDVLIVDYDSKGFIEKDDISKVPEVSPDTRLLVLSDDNNKESILDTIKKGVTGYLTKSCGKDEIVNAINSVARGEKFFCNKILDIIIEKHYNPRENYLSPALSEREIEITKLITKGYSNKEIADRLFLSIHTVYTHRKNIMKKLNIKSPVELVLYALNVGLLDDN